MSKRNQPRNQRRVRNAIDRQQSGMGTKHDFNVGQIPAFPWVSPLAQDQFATQLYYTDWCAKKIVQIPVDDMLRDGWRVTGCSDEEKTLIEAENERLRLAEVVREAMRLERLVGGAAIFLGAADGEKDSKLPLNVEALNVKGSMKFLNTMPRSRVSHVTWNTDPTQPGYGRPETFLINGHTINHTRLVLFRGDPLLPIPDYSITPIGLVRGDGFGTSVLLTVWQDLERATGSRQAAYQMVQRASIFLAEMDLQDMEGNSQGDAAVQAMRDLVNQINVFRGAVLDRQPGATGPAVSTIATQFGSVPELVMSFLQVLSAASDIPATRFLGQAPGGLNATGESDLENYYGRLQSDRTKHLVPKLLPLQRLVATSALGYVPQALGIEFDPLWELSESEEADVRKKDIDNVMALWDAGFMNDEQAIQELNAREVTSVELTKVEPQPLPAVNDPNAPPLDQTLPQLQE